MKMLQPEWYIVTPCNFDKGVIGGLNLSKTKALKDEAALQTRTKLVEHL